MSKEARMAYEARIAEIMDSKMDSKTREYEARTEGRAEGVELAKKIFKLSAKGNSITEIAKECQISEDEVKEILE